MCGDCKGYFFKVPLTMMSQRLVATLTARHNLVRYGPVNPDKDVPVLATSSWLPANSAMQAVVPLCEASKPQALGSRMSVSSAAHASFKACRVGGGRCASQRFGSRTGGTTYTLPSNADCEVGCRHVTSTDDCMGTKQARR